MAKNDSQIAAICDAGPIIHLDELESLDLLLDFNHVIIPKSVQTEVIKHRPKAWQHSQVVFKVIETASLPEEKLLILSNALLLDKGEVESLSLIQQTPNAIFLTDDAAARLAGEELKYSGHIPFV